MRSKVWSWRRYWIFGSASGGSLATSLSSGIEMSMMRRGMAWSRMCGEAALTRIDRAPSVSKRLIRRRSGSGALMLARISAAIALSLALHATAAAQQKYPSRNVEIIIPFAVGRRRRSDRPRRRRLARPSSSGRPSSWSTAMARPARSASASSRRRAPDGHTLGFGPSTPIANAPYLVKGVRYTAESFDYICQVFENVFTIAVGPNSKFKTAQELVRRRQGDRRPDLRARRPRLDPASLGREPRRRAEDQGAASAVPRRRRDAAGADQGRSRFRLGRRSRRSAATTRSGR